MKKRSCRPLATLDHMQSDYVDAGIIEDWGSGVKQQEFMREINDNTSCTRRNTPRDE